jgi:hypothetical protein
MKRIPFKSSETNDHKKVGDVFAENGHFVVDIQREMHMWIWVLTDDGGLWLLDKSHGGGGYFELQPEKKNV